MKLQDNEIRDVIKCQNLKNLDHECLWHPFTQMKEYEAEDPLIIESGEGNWLIDIEGKKYLDGVSSLWVTVHGHRKKELDEALKKQIDKIAHSTLLGLSNTPALLLAEALLKIVPQNLKKVFYSDSGSTAVEIALKIAYQYFQNKPETQKKTQFVTLENAYHGDTIGSVSVGGIDLFHSVYKQLLFQSYKIKNFDLVWAENLLKEKAQEIAAVFIEPLIQGAAGMLLQPPGFLEKLRKLTQKYGVLLIVDEVATGFGRTGKMFACEHQQVQPDLMCVAKGLTGGYLPLAATLATPEIYEGFYTDYVQLKTFFHGHTYTGNPLACAVALANLEIFKKEKTIEALQPKIKLFQELLADFPNHPHIKEVRQMGLMIGVELIKDKKNNQEYELAERIGNRVILQARKKGVVIRPLGSVIVLMPPLSITEEEIHLLVKVLKESIDEVCG
ncbi:MAG: adenosylmethionine--8-amino-7-oxononanoate transaminase [Deltaproteobacteria bacterium]|nr:adenosylmethionine--8-amino-7-oxononanoate transaminase [Deltaproteobacteria bacterium]